MIQYLTLSLLLLLLATPSTTQPAPPSDPRVANLRHLESLLSAARFAQTCPAFLKSSARILRQTRTDALSCARNDLPLPLFTRLRRECMARPRLQIQCEERGPSRPCERLVLVKQTCARIGFTRSTRRFCARLSPLEFYLGKIAAFNCPAHQRDADVDSLADRVSGLAESIREDVGLAAPAYDLRVTEPIRGPASSVLILLHGFGGMATDWDAPIALMRAKGFSRTRFIAPQAPEGVLEALNSTGPSWFDIPSRSIDGPQATEQIIAAARNIANIIEVQHRVHGVAYEKIAVMGFSQGAALTLTVYLRHRVAAAVALSGFVPIVDTYPAGLSLESAAAPVLLFHGDRDVIVPVEAARLSEIALMAFGRDVVYTEFEREEHGLRGTFDYVAERAFVLFKSLFIG